MIGVSGGPDLVAGFAGTNASLPLRARLPDKSEPIRVFAIAHRHRFGLLWIKLFSAND